MRPLCLLAAAHHGAWTPTMAGQSLIDTQCRWALPGEDQDACAHACSQQPVPARHNAWHTCQGSPPMSLQDRVCLEGTDVALVLCGAPLLCLNGPSTRLCTRGAVDKVFTPLAASGRPALFADGPTMFNALSNVVGYLNAEGYCNANRCHVSSPLSLMHTSTPRMRHVRSVHHCPTAPPYSAAPELHI